MNTSETVCVKPPKELQRRIAKLEREQAHLQSVGHRTYNWRPRVAEVERKLAKARVELRRYDDPR